MKTNCILKDKCCKLPKVRPDSPWLKENKEIGMTY